MTRDTNPLPRAPLARGLFVAAVAALLAACSSGGRDETPPAPPAAANTAPQIANLADLAGNQDTSIGPVSFNVTDAESTANDLIVVARSSNIELLPAEGVMVSGTGASRQLMVVPAEELSGVANVTVTARDPQGLTTDKTIVVAIRAVPGSIRSTSVNTFALSETAPTAAVNGITFAQDANDPAIYDAILSSVPGD
jgi:hypothetical protein